MSEKELEIKDAVLLKCRDFTKYLEGQLRHIENVQANTSDVCEKIRLHKRYAQLTELVQSVNIQADKMFKEQQETLVGVPK